MNPLEPIKKGDVLTVAQVAQQYGITTRGVTDACTSGRLTPDEAIRINTGWLITRTGAERLWQNKNPTT